MKKVLFFILTALIGLGSLQLSAQQLVEIGAGSTTTNSYLPLYSFYNNTLSEQIYTAAEVGMSGTITSIAFYNAGSTKTPDLKIYMINTNKTEFSSTTDWFTVTASDLVYDGTSVSLTAGQWTTIQLDNPFVYDGTSNLGLIVDAHLSYSSGLSCYVFSGTSNCAMYVYSDGTDYSAVGATYTASSRLSVKNRIQLEIIAGAITCHHVGTVTASGITPDDATITWNTPEDAGTYMLQYKTSTDDWNSSNVVTVYPNDTTYDFSGALSPMTTYDVRVANLCTNGDTSMWRSTSFTTACSAITTLPYTEGFDTYGTGTTAYPSCWSKINTYTSGDRPYVNTTHYSGVGSLYFYAGSGTYNIAITPMFDQSIPINTLQADFMYRGYYASDRLIVGVMSDFTDASTFVPVDTVYPETAYTTWCERSVSFANYTGTGQYIAFKNEYTTTYGYAYVDELSIDLIPNCPKPQYVTLSNYTTSGCDVTWVPAGTESAWEVVAVPAGTDPSTGTPESAYSIPHTLTNLLDGTQYDVYVRADCGNDYSAWSFKATFTTNPFCTSPLNVTIGQVTGSSAMVTWNSALYGATGYTVGYSEAGQGNWTTQSVTGTTCMLSGLTPETDYDVFVVSVCDQGNADSVFSDFSTHCLAGGDPFTEGSITTYLLPLNNYYNYTYTQQIYLASEMGGAATLDSLAFYYNYSTPSSVKTNVTIYLGHTSQSTFSGTSNYIPSTNLTQVYTGPMNCSQGWNTFVFTTPFQYNGAENLVLVVDDNSGDYDGNSYVFSAHNAGDTRALYYYSDSYNPDPTNPTSAGANSSTTTNRSNVKFFIPCDNTITCIAPNVYVDEIDESSITVAWAPGGSENSWELEYSTDGTNWTPEGIVSTTPYTISNLAANTEYYIHLRSVCGGGTYSNWSSTSARTACSNVNIPFTENFDSAPGSGSGNMVTCWTTGSNYTSTHYPYTSSSQHHSGGYSAYFYGTSAYYSYLASPEFDQSVNMSNLQVRFYAYKSTASYFIQVGVMTDPNDPSTFVQVGQNLTPSTTSTWEYIDVNTNNYTGTGRYIAFRIPAVSTSYMYIDDITVDEIPVCLHVDNIQVSNITTTSADLDWTVGGSETEWDVVYGLAGTITDPDNETPITVSGTPEVNLSGLYPSMGYDVYVRAVCSATESSIWWQTSFNTACGEIATLPFMENFDNMGTGSTVFPNCWYRYNDYSTSSSYPYVSSSYHTSGNASLYFYCSTSTYNIAVLPAIDVNTHPINTLQVSFQMRSTSSTTSGIQVGVMTDSANVSSFVSLQTVHNTTTGTFQSFEVPLTNYTGTGNRIALKLVNTSSTYSVYLDDLVVELTPLCDKPTNVTVSNITATTADVNWIPGGNETDWEMVVVPAGANVTAGTPEPVSTHPYTLTNLSDNTSYDVYVRADCGTGTDFSSWSQVKNFTTTPWCSAPLNVEVSQIAGTSALLTWTEAIFGATSYTVAYTETGMNNWTTLSVTGSSYLLTNLTPETAYTLTITSECDQGTAPVVTKSFTTPCLFGGDNFVGNGTSSSYNIPLNTFYNYSYVQQLYLASEINNSGDIHSIGFQYIYSTAQTKNNQSIYLAETDLTTLSTWIPADSLTLVYSGSVNYNNSGPDNWVTITLDSTFNYSGTRNLVVVVKNDHGSYSTSSNNTFQTHSASGMTVQYYDDSNPFSLTTPSSASTYSYRNNIKFGMECDNTITCIAPNVYVSDATENSITFNWAAGNNESSWELETSTDNATWTSQGTVTTAPYTLNNLTPSTLYYIRMRSVCGGGEYSSWTTISQRTDCAPIATLPYMENFDSYTGATSTTVAVNNLPYCWSFHNEGTNSSYSGYPMIYASATYAASGSNSIRFYTYTTSGTYDDQTAILPAIDVNTIPMNTVQVSFDARQNSSSYPFVLEIGVMTDPTNINTFMLVSTVTVQSTTYANFEVPLNQYSGTGAYIAIRAPQPTANYNYGYVDNVVVELIPSCPKPQNLHATNSTISSIELAWTEVGSATSWEIAYGAPGFDPTTATNVVTATTNPYEVTGLNNSTTYEFYVRAICSANDVSAWSASTTTSTTMVPTDLPYATDFTDPNDAWILNNGNCANHWVKGTYNGGGALFVTNDGTTPGYDGTSNAQISAQKLFTVGAEPTITISFDVQVNGESSFDFMKLFLAPATQQFPASSASLSSSDYGYNSYSTYAYDFYTNGYGSQSSYHYVLNVVSGTIHVIADMPNPNTNPDANSTALLVFAWRNDPSVTNQPPAIISNLTVGVITCQSPTGITASNISTTSADISWTPGGTETQWSVEYKEATASTWTTATVTSPNYQLTGLTATTMYNVRVKALCSATDESFYTNYTFNTANCDLSSQCGYTFVLGDGYGDGWNDGYLTVEQNGVVVATVEAVNHNLSSTQTYDTVTVNLCDNISTSLVWHTGSFDDEVSITLRGPDGSQLFTIDGLDMITSTTIYTFTTDCSGSGPGPVPTDPTVATNAATGITQTAATLNGTITNPDNVTITAKGFEWKATAGGTYTPVTVTGNNLTYNLTGLTANTGYTYKAFITFNGNTVYGSEQTFTTLPEDTPDPCDVPTGLHTTNIQNESIAIAWDANPNVNSWNIQYRPVGGQLSSTSSNTNSYTITGLTMDTQYEIQVQAVCANGSSDWCTAITAQTTNVGIESWLNNSVSLYPNPAKEYVDVRVDGDLNVTMMEVYDVYGKLINTVNVIDNPTRINVSGLANGMYFVRVTTEEGTVTKTFVKR